MAITLRCLDAEARRARPALGGRDGTAMGEQRESAVTEIRLGLVCYGGVSLAVYTYGVTAAIFAMVRASRALERGASPATGSSEAVYLAWGISR